MISIRKTATELDRLEELSRAAVTCYAQALGSTSQHAVELDPADVAQFRIELQALRDRLEEAGLPEQLDHVQASFDSQLRDYHDKTHGQIQRLRKEIEAATAAVEAFARSVTANGTDLEAGLNRELHRLNQAAASDDLNEIRSVIHSATTKIAASVEQMREANQMVIAQLKDEIRLLHQEVRAARSSRTNERAEDAEAGKQMKSRMDEMLRHGKPFSVLLVVVTNLDGMLNCHPPNVIESGLQGFESRLAVIVPGASMAGRWSRNQFIAVLGTQPAGAMAMSNDAVQKLSAPFVEQDRGVARSLSFAVKAGVVEFRPGADPARFLDKLQQLAAALAA